MKTFVKIRAPERQSRHAQKRLFRPNYLMHDTQNTNHMNAERNPVMKRLKPLLFAGGMALILMAGLVGVQAADKEKQDEKPPKNRPGVRPTPVPGNPGVQPGIPGVRPGFPGTRPDRPGANPDRPIKQPDESVTRPN